MNFTFCEKEKKKQQFLFVIQHWFSHFDVNCLDSHHTPLRHLVHLRARNRSPVPVPLYLVNSLCAVSTERCAPVRGERTK